MAYKIFHVSTMEFVEIKPTLIEGGQSFIAEVDGVQCKTKNDYLLKVSSVLQFPERVNHSWDAYLDWIRDLTWIDANKKIVLIVYSFSKFLRHDTEYRALFLSDFEKCIFPFWKKEVLDCVVDGKTREFDVYLVD